MFVGHATLAFGAVALLALQFGASRERALALGATAGLFAAIPDVDMAYAVVGLVAADASSAAAAVNSFWGASTVVHRAVTHSIVVAVPAAAAFALAPTRRRLAGAALLALVGAVAVVSGPLGAFVVALFVAAGWLVAVGAHRVGVRGRTLFVVALAGLASHPFGDLFTGEPPRLLYPLGITVFDGRVALSADPTLHLLGAFGVELAAVWVGVLAALALADQHVLDHLNGRAAAGAAYAAAVLVIPPPTLEVSYQFVFSVVAVGVVAAIPIPRRRSVSTPTPFNALVTGLTAVTLAGAAYTVAYLAGLA